MIIKEISLTNWKNFEQVHAECGRRCFIIGPNASGKSNFLDALRFLREVAQDGLQKAVTARGGMKALRYLNARKRPEVGVSVTLDDGWRYDLHFRSPKPSASAGVSVSKECVYRVDDDGRTSTVLERPDIDDKADPMRLSQTALEQVNTNKSFREVADYFRSVRYIHILPQVVRDPKSFSPVPSHNDPYGRDLVSQIWNTNEKTRTARLKRISEALKPVVPQFRELSVEQDKATGLPHLKAKYTHWRPHGAFQNESLFSDGTLRLIALLWAMLDTSGPLLLEEPELSLHEEIVRQLPGMFARLDKTKKRAARQVFVTTHSRAMLEDSGIGSDEVLRLEQNDNGSIIHTADRQDVSAMKDGLSAADVLLPKTSLGKRGQMFLDFAC